MPAFIHQRAEHILAKNPSMPKSEAFAIATQQSHALDKTPKGYGTEEGRETAKAKYQTPGDDKKTANPGNLDSPKMAALGAHEFNGFVDELLNKVADKLPGGLADNKKPSDFPQKELREGEKHEHHEHTRDPEIAREVAMDHLVEDPHYYSKLDRAKIAGIASNLAGALKNPTVAGHATELAGLGVLAVPGLDTMQAGVRSRLAGDRSPEGMEKRRLLGEGAHAAADVGGLGILMGPEIGHLRHLKMAAAEPKTDQDLKEVGRQRGVTNLAAEAAREKGRRGERFGEAFGRIAGGVGGAALGRHLIGGRIGTIAGMAGGLMAGGRLGKELGTERDIHKNASAFPGGYSQYGGNQAPNGPGMKSHSPLPQYREPPLATKEAATPVEAGLGLSGLMAGYSSGKNLAGETAAHLAPEGRVTRSENIARHLATAGAPAGGLAALAANSHYGLSRRLLNAASRKFPEVMRGPAGTIAEMAAPIAAAAGGSMLGGIATGGGVGLVQRLRGPKYERQKQAGVGVGSGMSTSQYSGPLSYGPFKMTSGIPPFRSPEMTRDDGSNSPAPWMVGVNKTAASLGALNASTTPAGRLAASQRVGAPKAVAPAGPSIAEISKPKGFGMPLAGTTKPLS